MNSRSKKVALGTVALLYTALGKTQAAECTRFINPVKTTSLLDANGNDYQIHQECTDYKYANDGGVYAAIQKMFSDCNVTSPSRIPLAYPNHAKSWNSGTVSLHRNGDGSAMTDQCLINLLDEAQKLLDEWNRDTWKKAGIFAGSTTGVILLVVLIIYLVLHYSYKKQEKALEQTEAPIQPEAPMQAEDIVLESFEEQSDSSIKMSL